MSRARLLGSFLVVLSLISCATAQSKTAEDVASDFINAWNTHNPKAFDRIFTDDATWVAVADARKEGRVNIVKEFAEIHTSWAKETTIVRSGPVKVQSVRPDVAVLFFHLGFQGPDGKVMPVIDRAMILVVAKQQDGWRIAAGQLTKQHEGE